MGLGGGLPLLFQLTSGNPDTSRENAKFELTKKRVVGVERSVNAENGTELMDTRSEFQLAPSGRNFQNGGATFRCKDGFFGFRDWAEMENNITTAVGVTGGHVQVRRADLSTDWIIRREYKKELDVGVVEQADTVRDQFPGCSCLVGAQRTDRPQSCRSRVRLESVRIPTLLIIFGQTQPTDSARQRY